MIFLFKFAATLKKGLEDFIKNRARYEEQIYSMMAKIGNNTIVIYSPNRDLVVANRFNRVSYSF